MNRNVYYVVGWASAPYESISCYEILKLDCSNMADAIVSAYLGLWGMEVVGNAGLRLASSLPKGQREE